MGLEKKLNKFIITVIMGKNPDKIEKSLLQKSKEKIKDISNKALITTGLKKKPKKGFWQRGIELLKKDFKKFIK